MAAIDIEKEKTMRGDGATTRQMQSAAKNAVFVWVNSHLLYPIDLAKKLGRGDLKIVRPSFFEDDRWRGLEFTDIIIDHAAHLNENQYKNYLDARTRIRLSKNK